MPPASARDRWRVWKENMSSGISGMQTILAEESASSCFVDPRMEAALAMTQMSQGKNNDHAGLSRPFDEDQARKNHLYFHQEYLARRSQRLKRQDSLEQTQNTTAVAAKSSKSSRRSSIQYGGSSSHQESQLSPSPDEVRRFADSACGTQVPSGCTAARVHPYTYGQRHTTSSDRPLTTGVVDEAELARMTREVLERPDHDLDLASPAAAVVGRFHRTCSATEVLAPPPLPTTTPNCSRSPTLSNFSTPSYAVSLHRPKVSAVAGRGSKVGGRRRRLAESRRYSSDEVDRRRAAARFSSLYGLQVLKRQSSDPSDRHCSPLTQPYLSAVSEVRRLRIPAEVSDTGLLNGSAHLVLPVRAVGEATPCWGLVPLSLLNVEGPPPCIGSTVQLSVPRVMELQEEEGVPVSSSLRLSLAAKLPDLVAAAAITVPLKNDEWSSDCHSPSKQVHTSTVVLPPLSTIPMQNDEMKSYVATDCHSAPKRVYVVPSVSVVDAQKQPSVGGVDKCDASAILKAMQCVKMEEDLQMETSRADMEDDQPLDLTRSAPDLTGSGSQISSKYDHHRMIPPGLEQGAGRSSSYGSLSALKAFYDDLSAATSESRKIRSDGSADFPLTAADSRPVEETHSTICEPSTSRDRSAKTPPIHNSRNANVLPPVACRSECRPARPSQNVPAAARESSWLLSETFDLPPPWHAPRATDHDENNSRRLFGTTGAFVSPTGLRLPRITTPDSGRSTGDATVVDSATQATVCSSDMEKRCSDGRLQTAEPGSRPAMDTLEPCELSSHPVNESSFETRLEENNYYDQKELGCIIEDGASKTVLDSPTATHEDLFMPSPPRCGSTGSSCSRDNNSDLSWRLPPKKRRVLMDPSSVAPPAESNAVDFAALGEDRILLPEVDETAARETHRVSPTECKYASL